MLERCKPRKRESHSRVSIQRPERGEILRKRLNRLPHWIRKAIYKAIQMRENRRRMTPAEKRRALMSPA